MKRLALAFLIFCLNGAMAQTPEAAARVAVAYYQICGRVPLDLSALNGLRSRLAVEADRTAAPLTLQARTGVLLSVGGHGTLLAVNVLDNRIQGDRAIVSVILTYQTLPPRKLEIALVKEVGAWKVAD